MYASSPSPQFIIFQTAQQTLVEDTVTSTVSSNDLDTTVRPHSQLSLIFQTGTQVSPKSTKRKHEETSPSTPSKRQKTGDNVKVKKTEADIRNDMLDRGALLLEFTINRPWLNNQDLTLWRAVEKKGFLVTDKGCLFPSDHQTRSKKTAYDLALKFFKGQERNPATNGTVNEAGWDCEDTVSHLCHRDECCSISHLELVPRWKCLRRNYCGLDGTCDCGMQPPCVDTYYPPTFARKPDTFLTYSTPGLGKKIKALFETDTISVKILPRNHYVKDDIKYKNKQARIKRSKKTYKETLRKSLRKSRLTSNSNSDSEEESI